MGVMLLGWLEVVVLLVVVISALITTSYLTTAIGKNTLKTDETVHAFMFVCVHSEPFSFNCMLRSL